MKDQIVLIQSENHPAQREIARDRGPFMYTLIVGSFDYIAGNDSAWLWGPVDTLRQEKMFDCNPCQTEIKFSNHLPSLIRESDIGGTLENVGDLDADGLDEIAYDAGWYLGCWGILELYKIKDKKWQLAGTIDYYACAEPAVKLRSRIKKLGNGKVKLIGDHAVYSDHTEMIYDLKADHLPCKTWEKKFEE